MVRNVSIQSELVQNVGTNRILYCVVSYITTYEVTPGLMYVSGNVVESAVSLFLPLALTLG